MAPLAEVSQETATNVLSDAAAEALRHPSVDVPALRRALKADVDGEIRFDDGSRALYSADASNYRQIPIGVVIPRTLDALVETVKICARAGAPVLPRGGGTSQNGQGVNVAVVIDASKYLTNITQLDLHSATVVVEPGVVCDQLRDFAQPHALTFGPDPATHSRCTLGGMIGNNSCGAHSIMAGKTLENLEALEIVTDDGSRFWVGRDEERLDAIIAAGGRQAVLYAQLRQLRDRYADLIRQGMPKLKRRVSGYNLDQLLPENGFHVARALVGTEGTCAVTARARVRLVPQPAHRVLLVVGFSDVYAAADANPELMQHQPIALEGLDEPIIGGLRQRGLMAAELELMPPGRGWLLAEFGAESAERARAKVHTAQQSLASCVGYAGSVIYAESAQQARIWSVRELGASATAMSLVPGAADPIVGWEDAAVDPAHLGAYLRSFQALIDEFGYQTCLYGHFGDGCVHARINFDTRSVQGLATMRRFLQAAAHLVVRYGGSLSGEHGDGQAKAEFLPIMFAPPLLQAMREFKQIWDPSGRLNPGKVIDAYRFDSNLRLGPDYSTPREASEFSFDQFQGNFGRAVEHCIGMGRCRVKAGALMCPSFQATGEEAHSTRGRSRLLFEMLQGEVIRDSWRSNAVKNALDTCLSCKGCRSECPTHVDMATYKAHFMARHYQGRLRPLRAYVLGSIHRWAPLASRLAGVVNPLMHTRLARWLTQSLLQIHPRRTLPSLARQSFSRWFRRRALPATSGKSVMLWPDTFNNYFHPETAVAATESLEMLGYHVQIPARRVCCGRTLYEFGQIAQAKQVLRQTMDTLRSELERGLDIIVLEPACAAVFRDELPNLFPRDALADRLRRQVVTLAEFLQRESVALPRLGTPNAIVHGHCHQKALWGLNAELAVLTSMGARCQLPEPGCCGMAGAYGLSKATYEISATLAEQALLPAVRAAAANTLVIANGFSCREQIAQGSARQAQHLSEVLRSALAKG